MSKNRDWLWPWEKDPNWIQDPAKGGNAKRSTDTEDDDGGKSVTAKTSNTAKKPPQYTLESAGIVVPDDGLKEGQSYRFKGKMRRLESATAAAAKISVQAVYRYKDKEQICGNPESADIDKQTLRFEGEFKDLFEPDAYHLDKNKPADAKYKLLLKFRGDCLDKDGFSEAVELPMVTKTCILKKGCYDKFWTDTKKDEATYPASGDKFFPSQSVKKVQTLLIKLGFLQSGNDTGYYGDLTETAMRDFQKITKSPKRSRAKEDKIFFIRENEITFTGADDGIYGPETEKELAQWDQNGWKKPKIHAKKDDVDDNGVKNGHGERGKENYHEKEQITEIQQLLKDIGAYKGKIDGWFGEKTEAAVKWFQECANKGELIDAAGKKVLLEDKDRLNGHRDKIVDEPTVKKAEEVKKSGQKVPQAYNSSEPTWITISRKEIGTQEIEGIENNPRVIEYHSTTDGKATTDEVPWCSAFVNWVMKQAGIAGTNNANAFSWKTWGKKIDKPCFGCIAICSFGHVGFIVGKRTYSPDQEGFLMLGGNQGKTGKGRVCVSWMPSKDITIFKVPADFTDLNYNLKDIDGNFHEINPSTAR